MDFSKLPSWLRFLPLAALGVFLAGGTANASEAFDVHRDAQTISEEAPFLWQVEGERGPSTLFGTIHAGVSMSELSPLVAHSLRQSDAFVMETVPHAKVVANANISGVMPMDFALAQLAEQEQKPVLGLETMRFQLNLLQKIGGNTGDLAAMLAEDPSAFAALTEGYRSGDLAAIESLTATDDVQLQQLLFSRRNARWVGQLHRGLRRGGLFVAVGVGHFPGEQGLLNLLEKGGFSPRRIS